MRLFFFLLSEFARSDYTSRYPDLVAREQLARMGGVKATQVQTWVRAFLLSLSLCNL